MASNGAYFNKKGDDDKPAELDEDLKMKMEMLQIGLDKKDEPHLGDVVGKSYEDWKDELPIHLKSLKFMIDVLNDKHKHPSEFASTTLQQIPPAFVGENIDMVDNSSEQKDRIFAPTNQNEEVWVKRPMPRFAACPTARSSGMGRKTRMDLMNEGSVTKNYPRRRTKSAEPNLSSYRNETPFGTRGYKHRHSESGQALGNFSWCHKRRSVDLNGVYVVEEISEEEEDTEELKRIASADGSPDSLSLDMELRHLHFNSPTAVTDYSSSLKPVHRLRRDLWNISPISEDFSESDKDMEMEIGVNDVEMGLNDNDNEIDVSISSTNATFGDVTMSMSFSNRMSCSSPILSHSPSLHKTPVSSSSPAAGSTPGGIVRKMRLCALDDISDRDEDHQTTTESETSEEEKTESFELDLAGGSETPEELSSLLNSSFIRDKSSSNLKDEGAGENENTTVWETLSANIQSHIDVGNAAGFTEGPIDHPLQVKERKA